MSAILQQLSLADALQLGQLASKPLLPLRDPRKDLFERCINLVLGRRHWADVIEEALQGDELEAALRARVRAVAAAEALPPQVEDALSQRWKQVCKEFDAALARARDLPLRSEAPEFAVEISQIRQAVEHLTGLPAALPAHTADIDKAFDALSSVRAHADDAKGIRELSAEVLGQRRARLVDAARKVAGNLLTDKAIGTALENMSSSPFLIALRALPELLADLDVDALDKLALPDALGDAVFMAALAQRLKTTAPSPARHAATSFAAPPPIAPPVRLAPVSQSIFDKPSPAAKGLESLGDLRSQRQHLRVVVSDDELGAKWMRTSKATKIPELARLALGIGLTAYARAYLDRDLFRFATELFRDACVALSLSGEFFDAQLFADASVGLVASRCYPRMPRRANTDLRPSDLLSRPELIFDWIRGNGFTDIIADLWADLPDGADSLFIEVVESRFISRDELRHVCAEAALTAQRLRGRPARTIRRIRELLDAAVLPDQVEDALKRAEAELSGSSTLTSAARRELAQAADRIASGLSQGEVPQPLGTNIGRRFSELLRRMSAVGARETAPKLVVTPLVNIFYPRECCDDVRLPVRVSNEKTGAPAPELTLRVTFDGPRDRTAPVIDSAEIAVPPLDADEDESVYSVLRFPPDAAEQRAAWWFRATLLTRGTDVIHTRRFSISLRDTARSSSNPFSAGQSVKEEERFFGRDAQMRELRSAYCGDREDVTLAVVGLRRIGKTSLVHHLLRDPEIQRRFVTDYWDAEDLDDSVTTTTFLIQFAERIRRLIGSPLREKIIFHRESFRDNPYAAFEQFSDSIAELPLKKPLLIALDEFDRLVKLARDGDRRTAAGAAPLRPDQVVQPHTFGALRKLLMKHRAIRLLLSGLPDIFAHTSYDDRLFGLLRRVDVGPFSPAEADRVIEQAAHVISFPPLVRAYLHDVSGLQPYLLQLICGRLFSAMLSSGRDQATIIDVDEVIQRDIVPNQASFADYDRLIQDDDRPLLRSLAVSQKAVVKRRRFVTPAEVVRELHRGGYSNATVEEVTTRLRALSGEERPLVTESGDYRGNFRLVIGLLAEHLIRRPM